MQGQQSSTRIRRSPDVVKGEIVKGSGGLACLIFVGLLACAFWAGAMLASHPLLH
jgi:hypothetical protein